MFPLEKYSLLVMYKFKNGTQLSFWSTAFTNLPLWYYVVNLAQMRTALLILLFPSACVFCWTLKLGSIYTKETHYWSEFKHWTSAILSCAAVSLFYKTGLRISLVIKNDFEAIVCTAPSAKSKVSHLTYGVLTVYLRCYFFPSRIWTDACGWIYRWNAPWGTCVRYNSASTAGLEKWMVLTASYSVVVSATGMLHAAMIKTLWACQMPLRCLSYIVQE